MFDFRNDNFTFTVSPFERVPDKEADPIEHLWDWIQCWIEFSVNGLKSQFQTEFTVGELKILRDSFATHYEALVAQSNINPSEFRSERHQLDMVLRKLNDTDGVIIEYILRPEAHADSVQVKGEFSINESYFPEILKRLDEMIAWQN